MATSKDVAAWMLQALEERQSLYQEVVVYEIAADFGEEFTYLNASGNLAIDRRVLREFRKLTEATVVWERGERLWRKRTDTDPPGVRQVD